MTRAALWVVLGLVVSSWMQVDDAVAETRGAALAVSPSGTKTFNPSPASESAGVILTINLANAGVVPITGVSFTDTYPLGMTNSPLPPITGCTGGVLSAVLGGNSVSLTGATVPPGGCNVSLAVQVSPGGTYVNTIPAGGVTSTNAGASATPITATLQVAFAPRTTKTFAPATVLTGQRSTLSVQVNNLNAAPMSITSLTDSYPALVVNANPPDVVNTCGGIVTAAAGGTSFTLVNGAVPANSACAISLDVVSGTPGTYVNTMRPGALQTAGSGNLQAVSATLVVQQAVAPTVTKSFSPQPISVGQSTTLTIRLTNPNAVALTGIAFTDTYPANLINGTPTGASTTCGAGTVSATAGGGSVALANGTIPANGNCTVTINVIATAAGTYTNMIGAGGVTSANAPASAAAAAAAVVVVVVAPQLPIPALSGLALALLTLLLIATALRVGGRH